MPIFDRDGAIARGSVSRPNAGTIVYPPRSTLGPRLQPDYQLVLVHSGLALVRIDGSERAIGAGYVGLLRPGHREFFQFARERPTHHSWIAVSPFYLTAGEREALDRAPDCLSLSPAMQAAVDLGCDVVTVDEPEQRPVLAAIARAALALYVAEAAHTALPPSMHPAIARARAVARQRAHEGIGVQDLARAVGLSAEHLVRLFRRELGVTPGAFLRAERLAHGIHLLEHTGLPVVEVAHRCGFASPHHFARCLRQATGLSPTEVRARRWAAPSSAGQQGTEIDR